MKIHFTSSKNKIAINTKKTLVEKYDQTPINKAEVIVAIGGDGEMLKALRESMSINLPVLAWSGKNHAVPYACIVMQGLNISVSLKPNRLNMLG